MAIFAPTHTGQFIIKPRALRRQRVWLLGLATLLVALPYAAYELGRSRAGFSVIDAMAVRQQQAGRIKQLDQQVAQLQRQLGSTQLDSQAQAQAFTAEQQSVAELQAKIQQQQQDLAFYKAIVSPAADAPNAPRVQRLEVEALPVAQQFLMRLMLVQTMNAPTQAQGSFKAVISGVQDGRQITLDLADVLVDRSKAVLSFAYRYFQAVEQTIQLPAGFEPTSVQVEVHATQHDVVRQSFAWQPKASLQSSTYP